MTRVIKRRCACGCGSITNSGKKWIHGHNGAIHGLRHRSGFKKNHKINYKHGLSKHPLYNVWNSIKSRCYKPKTYNYKYYGAKNINVCIRWRKSFKSFYNWAMTHGYEKGLHLHRIDPTKNYSPSNCKFIAASQHIKSHKPIKLHSGI